MATQRQQTPDSSISEGDLKEVVAVARAVVDQEVEVTQRLENKARQQVVLAAQWFAIVQAVFAVALNHEDDSVTWLVWTAAGLAIVGGLVLGLTILLGWCTWRVRADSEVTPHGLIQMKEKAHHRDGVLDAMVVHYANLLQARRANNRVRSDWAMRAEYAWFIAMFIPFAQLAAALAAILLV